MDDLANIVHFVEVARAKSFTRAAEKLRTPASTLSRRISGLETSLGLKLLSRTTRRVELTEAGRLYLGRCERIVDDARTARDELHDLTQKPRGLLRVSMVPDFDAAFLGPLIAEFADVYPEIALQFDLSPRRVDLIGEGFDLAIRVGIPAEPNLVARRLVLAQRGIYASPAFLTNHRKPRIPADLSALSCLTVDHPDGNNTWVLRRGRNVEEVAVHGRIKANNARMLLQLAIEGVGIAVADELTASGFVQTGRLRRLLHGWEITPVPIYAVTGSRMLPTKTRLFVDHFARRLKQFAASSVR